MRAVSTVLDAAFFLLLVSGAVLTLTLPAGTLPVPDADAADGTADVLATSTADVQYSLAPGARHADGDLVSFPRSSGPAFHRSAHGTLADHLATAAVGNLTVAGERVTHTRDGFRREVANETRALTRSRDHLARVRAVWEPYPGAPVRGEVVVGPSPPPSATVHAATLTVDSGMPDAREAAQTAAASGGFDEVGAAVATRVVEGVVPRRASRTALLGDYPVDRLVEYRYRRLGRVFGTNVTAEVRANEAGAANAKLSAALGERLADDMRTRFESPSAAADRVSVGRVRITVRTWSP